MKIKSKVNNEKNILLININKLNNRLKFYINNAFINKEIIKSLSNKYNIIHPLIEKKSKKNFLVYFKIKKQNSKHLWIYLKEEQKYSTDSYTRYEEMILEHVKKKKIDFIAIGEKSLEFLKKHKLKVINFFSHENKNIASELALIIKFLYLNENYSQINFVFNSNKNYNGYFTILPMNQFDINKLVVNEKLKKEINFSEFSIYPNINEFIENSFNVYLENSIKSLIIESTFYNTKNNLVRTKKIIKELDEKISKIARQITKTKRENEIEEIVMITKNNQKFHQIIEEV
nr:hypothetical protein [Mycoplasmopsis cricetuli]